MGIFVYDLPGTRSPNPEKPQMGLQMRYVADNNENGWCPPLCYSVNLPKLKRKMKEHRFDMVSAGVANAMEYRIVDDDGNEYYRFIYEKDEVDDIVSKPRASQSKYSINFVRIDDIDAPSGYYYVINDADENCITNIKLLRFLRDAVWHDHIPMSNIMKPLAYLATYIPKSLADIENAYGFGEKLANKIGPYLLKK